MHYHEYSVQSLIRPWWEKSDSKELIRGKLLRAFIPHVDQTPRTLTPVGRINPTDHEKALFKLESLRVNYHPRRSLIPVTMLPQFENEVYTVHRSKLRPALVIGLTTNLVPDYLRRGEFPKYQTAPTMIVAPYYGERADGKRCGWPPELINRIRICEYPQYFLDILPIGNDETESVLRLDHLQPVGLHYNSYLITDWKLSDDAMKFIDEQLRWFIKDEMPYNCDFRAIRDMLYESVNVNNQKLK